LRKIPGPSQRPLKKEKCHFSRKLVVSKPYKLCYTFLSNNKYLSILTMVTGRFSEISIQFCQTKWSLDNGFLQLLPTTDFKLQHHTSFVTFRNRANQRDMPRTTDSQFFTVGHPNFFE